MSKIEWTDRSDWNPVRGCTRVSEGCRNCYAEEIAGRFSGRGQPWHGFAEKTASGPRWTGNVALMENRLTLPLKWRKPARIFVNSAADLFHESVPDEWIDRVFAVMALAPQHSFIVLTKRAKRMREYLSRDSGAQWKAVRAAWFDAAEGMCPDRAVPFHFIAGSAFRTYPLPNVILGVSVERQQEADERIPDLLATPAAKRIVSAEPLLGSIHLHNVKSEGRVIDALRGESRIPQAEGVRYDLRKWPRAPRLDGVIRYAVEHKAVGGDAFVHIYAGKNLRVQK